jgi:flagellar biosynthesis GTPase FlhF
MQLRKFYGKSMAGTLARVRQALGSDALILETRELPPGHPAARLHAGARYEIVAAAEPDEAPPPPEPTYAPRAGAPNPYQSKAEQLSQRLGAPEARPSTGRSAIVAASPVAPVLTPKPTAPARPVQPRYSLLADLGELKAQLNTLFETATTPRPQSVQHAELDHPELDLSDYHALISLGIDHAVLAPHFRAWLQWRTASPQLRRYLLAAGDGPMAKMQSESLREWLLHIWSDAQQSDLLGFVAGLAGRSLVGAQASSSVPRIIGLLGPTGAGKTTTLAKLASISRQENRQKTVIVTLDTHRLGATEQWRKLSKIMGTEVHEIVTQADLTRSMETWGHFDWIGIDTPGSMTPGVPAGQLYGHLLAHCNDLKTVMVLPVTQQEQLSQHQMQLGQSMGADQIVFTKVDEGRRAGGSLGSIVNLSLGRRWPVAGLTTGTRVPEDFAPATSATLWEHVLAPTVGGAA